MELNILLYTHTDYKDAWAPFFGQINKFLPDSKLYVLVNDYDYNIPAKCNIILYDDKKKYSDRIKDGLGKLSCDYFLFIHEDMFLYDKPNNKIIERYIGYIKDKSASSIKLIYVDDVNNATPHIDSTLILNRYSKFSIQPTLILKDTLYEKLNELPPLNIYELEEAIQNNNKDFMCKIGGEIKIGSSHYNSLVFPYIATAIVKGKWNYLEYKNELDIILNEYNIDKNKRGIF
jgi:hypothetical protein